MNQLGRGQSIAYQHMVAHGSALGQLDGFELDLQQMSLLEGSIREPLDLGSEQIHLQVCRLPFKFKMARQLVFDGLRDELASGRVESSGS